MRADDNNRTKTFGRSLNLAHTIVNRQTGGQTRDQQQIFNVFRNWANLSMSVWDKIKRNHQFAKYEIIRMKRKKEK